MVQFFLQIQKIVQIHRCIFKNISSTSSPGCFYIQDSNVKVTKCSFDSCFASQHERQYGNAYYCYNCYTNLEYSYTVSCSPTKDISGDSAIALIKSQDLHLSHINSSKCCGQKGASLLTYRENQIEDNIFSYVIIVDPCDWTAIESCYTKNSYFSFTIIVNSNQSIQLTINNKGTTSTTFSNSTFINPHSTFSVNAVNFNNCYSNTLQICSSSCTSISNINNNEMISFDSIFDINPNCIINNINNNNDYQFFLPLLITTISTLQ